MTDIDLAPYCSKDPFRGYLHKPFSFGDFTYSTNGHILVRVLRRNDAPETTKEANWNAPLDGLESATFSPLMVNFPPVPVSDTEKIDCDICDGRGRDHDCPDCECICDACDGSGKAEPYQLEQKISTIVRGATFSLFYIRMMMALPGIQVMDNVDLAKPLMFRFDGGAGAIMPLRGQYDEHLEIEKAA